MTVHPNIFEFTEWEVRECDFSRFLQSYGPAALPVGEELRPLFDSLVFTWTGWEEDQRLIYTVPEFRRFFLEFHSAWPYWLTFCSLKSDSLKAMLLCCLEPVHAKIEPSRPEYGVPVEYDSNSMVTLIISEMRYLDEMFNRAGLDTRSKDVRIVEILEYVGMKKLPLWRRLLRRLARIAS